MSGDTSQWHVAPSGKLSAPSSRFSGSHIHLEREESSARGTLTYAKLLALAEDGLHHTRAGRSPDSHVRLVRNVLMDLVDRADSPPFQARLLALGAIPPQVDPYARHAADVCVLSVFMGLLLGLSRGHTVDLAFAAFHHDLGRARILRQAAVNAEDEDPLVAEGHVRAGLALALRAQGLDDGGILRLLVIQEHHRRGGGYPSTPGLPEPHPLSRLVGVADAYDRLRHGTPWRAPVSPRRALQALEERPERYDPRLVDLLRDVVGEVPAGTLLRLGSGDVVLVVDGGARRGHRPLARRLFLADGSPDMEWLLDEVHDLRGAEELSFQEWDLNWDQALLL